MNLQYNFDHCEKVVKKQNQKNACVVRMNPALTFSSYYFMTFMTKSFVCKVETNEITDT